MTTPRDLTVVIPTRDRWPILARTLTALHQQTVTGFRVVVVVDGTDQQVSPDLPADVLVQPQAGPGAARNTGIRAVGTELVLLLGDDMVPTPGLVAAHLERHRSAPEPTTGVLGSVRWHPEVATDAIARWLDRSGLQFDFGSIRDGRPGFGHFCSCNVSLHRSALTGVGGFDEDFPYYYEDLDLGRRLDDAGVRLLHAPDAVAEHLHRYTWGALERRFAGIARGERVMAAKHGWFDPWFRSRIGWATAAAPRSRLWAGVDAVLPEGAPPAVRRVVRARTDTAHLQRLAPAFQAAWDGERDLDDLRRYLGERYEPARLARHRQLVDAEQAAAPDEATFYRTSQAYLYDLTVFALSGTKAPYLEAVRSVVAPGAHLLDLGCGIGADGLRLMDSGYRVDFADFASPSTAFLRWRLADRGLTARLLDVERGLPPAAYGLAYAFDVLEHVDDPVAVLQSMEARAGLVAVNLLEPAADDPHSHRPLPIRALVGRAADRGLVLHRRHHGRSHLIVYRGDVDPPEVNRLRSAVEHRLGPAAGPVLDRQLLRLRRSPAARRLRSAAARARP